MLHLVCDLPSHYQIVCVRNSIHLFENVQNFVRNCPKSMVISSGNFCPKIKYPKIKRPKSLEINVVMSPCVSEDENIRFRTLNEYEESLRPGGGGGT